MVAMVQDPLVSIIIPTKNSGKHLGLCLKSIDNQTLDARIETIVVDGGSVDDTVKIAMQYGAKIYFYKGERSKQKNFGAKKATGSYLYFIDSDFWLHPRVLEEALKLASKGYDAIIVPNISDPRPSIWAKTRFLERMSYYGTWLFEAARFVSRRLFFKIGGFDESLYANEDYDLHARLMKAGARIGRLKGVFEIHLGEPRSLKEITIKSLYYGSSLKSYFSKNPNPFHAMPVRPSYINREFLAWAARRWPEGVGLIFLLKMVQAFASFIGGFLKLDINPYER